MWVTLVKVMLMWVTLVRVDVGDISEGEDDDSGSSARLTDKRKMRKCYYCVWLRLHMLHPSPYNTNISYYYTAAICVCVCVCVC